MYSSYETEERVPGNGKKTGKLNKALHLICGGFLFGSFAGLAVVAVLNLFSEWPVGPEREDTDYESVSHITETGELSMEDSLTEMPDESPGEYEKTKISQMHIQQNSTRPPAESDAAEDRQEMAVVTDVTRVVDAVMPSVVSIWGTYMVSDTFWGYEISKQEGGSGSGIIIGENEEEILIVTNHHVVQGSTSLMVQFADGQSYDATVKGTDADMDLAVISIPISNLTEETRQVIRVAVLGDSASLQVGEPAIAIGNALGYGQSVTTGVISAVDTSYTIDENGESFSLIQTDAAINPGNSGGALLNVYGEVIGINSSKIADDMVEGMGYAIPVSEARPVIEELKNKKTRIPVSEEDRGYLGISGINVTEDLQQMYGFPEGVYVARVFDGTAADVAGLGKGDIITSFDGEGVETMEELSAILDCMQEGSAVAVNILKATPEGYEEQSLEVVLRGRD